MRAETTTPVCALLGALLLLAACGPAETPDDAGPKPETLPETPRALEQAEPEVRAAVEELIGAVNAQPESAKAWGALGDRYRANDWLPDATTAYRRAAELAPGEFLWHYLLGHVLVTSDAEGATRALEAAVEIDPEYAPALIYLARQLVQSGELDRADELLARASEKAPINSYAPLLRGQAAMQRGEPRIAIAHFQEAIRRQPKHGEAYQALAQAFGSLGLDEKAKDQAELAKRVPLLANFSDPRLSNPAPALGARERLREAERLARRTEFAAAEEQVRIVLQHSPRHADAHRMLGLLLARLDHDVEAETELREAVRLAPDSVPQHVSLAEFLLARGRKQEALEPLSVVLRLQPDAGVARTELARVLADLGDGEEAWALICEGLAMDTGNEAQRQALLDVKTRWEGGDGPAGGCD